MNTANLQNTKDVLLNYLAEKGAQFNSSVDDHTVATAEYSAKTVHEEWYVSHSMHLCPKSLDFRVQ